MIMGAEWPRGLSLNPGGAEPESSWSSASSSSRGRWRRGRWPRWRWRGCSRPLPTTSEETAAAAGGEGGTRGAVKARSDARKSSSSESSGGLVKMILSGSIATGAAAAAAGFRCGPAVGSTGAATAATFPGLREVDDDAAEGLVMDSSLIGCCCCCGCGCDCCFCFCCGGEAVKTGLCCRCGGRVAEDCLGGAAAWCGGR